MRWTDSDSSEDDNEEEGGEEEQPAEEDKEETSEEEAREDAAAESAEEKAEDDGESVTWIKDAIEDTNGNWNALDKCLQEELQDKFTQRWGFTQEYMDWKFKLLAKSYDSIHAADIEICQEWRAIQTNFPEGVPVYSGTLSGEQANLFWVAREERRHRKLALEELKAAYEELEALRTLHRSSSSDSP